MAYVRRGTPTGLIYHSDHGSQYISSRVQAWPVEHGIQASMGSVGGCYDNAVRENVHVILKREGLPKQACATRRQSRTHVLEFLEVFYDRQRLHSTLDYQTPVEYEEQPM